MDQVLPLTLGVAVLAPLVSFFLILVAGPRMGKAGQGAAYLATAAIGTAALLSFVSLAFWLAQHWPAGEHHGEEHASIAPAAVAPASPEGLVVRGQDAADAQQTSDEEHHAGHEEAGHEEDHGDEHHEEPAPHYAGEYTVPLLNSPWVLGQFGDLRVSISYYIDALTLCMFCMVTFIATLIHIYAMGYMHEELHDVTDREVVTGDGSFLHRPGRYSRFFQYLSLFCFSMLGLVVAGNILMVFVFWELVGVCSYFLIGFYIERKSASNAANKAFIVNRVGDFGMIIGLMALWTGLGTFSFGDIAYRNDEGEIVQESGIFRQVRPADNHYQLAVPAGMARFSAADEVAYVARRAELQVEPAEIERRVQEQVHRLQAQEPPGNRPGYGLMIVAGLGIFAGCVGKSAQFPLHTWLPDAMEGPTPVSALVHSATMVAAGVYLVARFYPVFVPEVLLVIAVVGCITLFMAATIAITATDIKRVLAYSTISQLGYMMMALGVGAWVAGVMHLITHAFFKSLLFLCSGSVIHAVHTNEMTEMGGLRKKMPVTAYTMLIGCLAIAGAGIPFIMGFFNLPLAGLGLSGFYSKDLILEQAFSFMGANGSALAGVFFVLAAGGAAITAFYMFRMWYMTFAGPPRDPERHAHAHESPPTMYVPLIILSVMAITVAWVPTQAILAGLVAVVLLILLSRRTAAEEHADRETAHGAPGHGAPGHGAPGHGAPGHEDQGGDHGHGSALPAWLSRLPLGLAIGVAVIAIIWALTPGPAGARLSDVVLVNLLEQGRPTGTLSGGESPLLPGWRWPSEHDAHAASTVVPVSLIAIGTAFTGFFLATLMYGLRRLDPTEVRRQFSPVYRFLVNKWWFDELYDYLFVRPTHVVSRAAMRVDQRWIDGFIDGTARVTRRFSVVWDRIADHSVVDGSVNLLARWTYAAGLTLRSVQTGSLRQYIVFIVVGAVAIFILISFFWTPTLAG